MGELIEIITADDPELRDRSLDSVARRDTSLERLRAECAELDGFRRRTGNLYHRVRALFFLYALHRFHVPERPGVARRGRIPYGGYLQLLQRRFEEAIEAFLAAEAADGPSDAISSALAVAYHRLAFQTLADQVRRSVRAVPGNQWMFRTGHPADHPLRIRPEMGTAHSGLFPLLREATPVRMDLSHSGWSDIFFLGMDHPEGARVLNASIDLCPSGGSPQETPRPPVEAWLRVTDEPVLRLVSVDLDARAEVRSIDEVFDFARDHLGLLKAAVIAAGVVPPGMEGAGEPLRDVLEQVVGLGRGLELVSCVHRIPKGSRLAVSTTLLASLITVCMRATGQTGSLTGPLRESERRLVAARAILGEWLGGSGGGWQDSGGVWPGLKLIRGERTAPGDAEHGVSRGRLLPSHRILTDDEVSPGTRRRLEESLVLVHGGMAQPVGPILEMVTERYLLRSEAEWRGRQEAVAIFDDMLERLRSGDVPGLGAATDRNFHGPIRTILPWAANHYTDRLIHRVREAFGSSFHGFWMLGGMAGGGMGFIFDPERKGEARERIRTIMAETKEELESAVAFAMDPVVYDFAFNDRGTEATLLSGPESLMPAGYYALTAPALLRRDPRDLTVTRRAELARFAEAARTDPERTGSIRDLFERLLPADSGEAGGGVELSSLLDRHGFDRVQHERIRADLRRGRIGLAQNRLPVSTRIEDVRPFDVRDAASLATDRLEPLGMEAVAEGAVAVVTLAGGAGSRWTQGAGVVKALDPFARLRGRHRNFIEAHLAKSRRVGRLAGTPLAHVVTTSYLTHDPIARWLERGGDRGYPGPLHLSPGRFVGLRMIPMARDLRFAWESTPQQRLDERAQKVVESLRAALITWAEEQGEGGDYTDNLPLQCLHPVGHWYEVPNLLCSGALARLLAERPGLRYLMVHNVDTLGADVDPVILGYHIEQAADLTTEVVPRRIEDRGGGLARIDGQVRLVEGLALPREELEFDLSFYNTSTSWVTIDRLLEVFGLGRDDLSTEGEADREARITAAVRDVAARMPTYVTLKDVKKRWGQGQEDVFPVSQFEKLWGDMTALPELDCRYLVVPRQRGQQLKEIAQLDGWSRDGSAAHLESIGDWD